MVNIIDTSGDYKDYDNSITITTGTNNDIIRPHLDASGPQLLVGALCPLSHWQVTCSHRLGHQLGHQLGHHSGFYRGRHLGHHRGHQLGQHRGRDRGHHRCRQLGRHFGRHLHRYLGRHYGGYEKKNLLLNKNRYMAIGRDYAVVFLPAENKGRSV